jgi:hypothetical protein
MYAIITESNLNRKCTNLPAISMGYVDKVYLDKYINFD